MLTAQPKPTALRPPEAFSGAGKAQLPKGSPAGIRAKVSRRRRHVLRAVISSGDSKTGVETTEKFPSLSSPFSSKMRGLDVRVAIKIRKKMKEKLNEKMADGWEWVVNGVGRGIQIQLISEDIDPDSNKGKTSAESYVRGWQNTLSDDPYVVEYAADLTVPGDFGQPGAVLVTNHHDKEFFLLEIVVHGFSKDSIFFWADTWIHSRKHNRENRIIFNNQAYLPSQTPVGIKELRQADLSSLRGSGEGKREMHERIYDYDVYNDLGNPDKSKDLARPIGGTEEVPYPRRCRTGRPPTSTDPSTETRIEKPHPVYVPRDEAFEETKQNTFSAGRLKALFHILIPLIVSKMSSSDVSFKTFAHIDSLYNDETEEKEATKTMNTNKLITAIINKVSNVADKIEDLLKYDLPAIIKRDRFAWLRDTEFARQTLAGVNPVSIELLKEFPIVSKLDPAVYGSPESAITKELIARELNGISVDEALKEKKLFIIDYHDILLPFIDKINSLPDRKTYASRTVFYYSETGVLKPIAIELSLPPTPSSPRNKFVYTQAHDATTAWIWKLAKAHVCSNDAGLHQLVVHWMKTHACVEPYIIATHRQLSSMHPVYKLLHPHMRYTLEINALARQSLINGGGIIEACFSPGKYAIEVSCAAYKNLWQFDREALPADLLHRGMAVEDPTAPGGVKLVIEDYPYAADGLLIWSAIKELVESYVDHYYSEPDSISGDVELQAWWNEIKNKGHHEKRNEPWWPNLSTQDDLAGILATMIWVASGQHAAVNFGQYPFGGYPPNRPTLMRKLIPREGDSEYEKFLHQPEYTFLTSLPTQLQARKVMAVQNTLSTHSEDEEYIHQLHDIHRQSSNDPEVQKIFDSFAVKLEEIERIIHQRNSNIQMKNRSGAGVPPYELLVPSSPAGVTARGIPNSISI